jgi:hypothetical protein
MYTDKHLFDFPVSDASGFGQHMLPLYANATVLRLGAAAQYQYRDLFYARFRLEYNRWKITKVQESITYFEDFGEKIAWHKPVFSGDWDLGFKPSGLPLRMELSYHLETGRKARKKMANPEAFIFFPNFFENTTVQLKNIHHVNTAVTYTFTDRFSIFTKINNLLCQKYDLWYNYPAQGFSIMLGANLKF